MEKLKQTTTKAVVVTDNNDRIDFEIEFHLEYGMALIVPVTLGKDAETGQIMYEAYKHIRKYLPNDIRIKEQVERSYPDNIAVDVREVDKPSWDFNNIMKSKELDRIEFDLIMSEISKHHRFARGWNNPEGQICRSIKYIRPNWDMRDMKCYHISFDSKSFDSRGSKDSMYDRIMAWLGGKDK